MLLQSRRPRFYASCSFYWWCNVNLLIDDFFLKILSSHFFTVAYCIQEGSLTLVYKETILVGQVDSLLAFTHVVFCFLLYECISRCLSIFYASDSSARA
jgi:hypothetical protein